MATTTTNPTDVLAVAADAHAAAKEARRVERIKAEHNTMRRVEELPGVKDVRTGLEYREVTIQDKEGNTREEKRARLTAEAELSDGRLVSVHASNAVELERLLYGRVKEAVGATKPNSLECKELAKSAAAKSEAKR